MDAVQTLKSFQLLVLFKVTILKIEVRIIYQNLHFVQYKTSYLTFILLDFHIPLLAAVSVIIVVLYDSYLFNFMNFMTNCIIFNSKWFSLIIIVEFVFLCSKLLSKNAIQHVIILLFITIFHSVQYSHVHFYAGRKILLSMSNRVIVHYKHAARMLHVNQVSSDTAE